jgi:hypothetical protein
MMGWRRISERRCDGPSICAHLRKIYGVEGITGTDLPVTGAVIEKLTEWQRRRAKVIPG